MNLNLRLKSVSDKKQLANIIDYCGAMRIVFFREQPYCYAGSFEYEKEYLSFYTREQLSLVVVAEIDSDIIGIATGIPFLTLAHFFGNIQEQYETLNININKVFYIGDVIVKPEHRGKGLASKLLSLIYEFALSQGFTKISVCTGVQLIESVHSKSVEKLLNKEGFLDQNLVIINEFPTVQMDGSIAIENHQLKFWIRDI
jgi:GNAT superfamily N-acetyltransferase